MPSPVVFYTGYFCPPVGEYPLILNLTGKKILVSYSNIIKLNIGDVSLLRKEKKKTFLID